MQNTLIARTFAQAFYNVISNSEEKEEIFSQYKFLVECMEKQTSFYSILETPKINKAEKKDMLERVFRNKFNNLFVDFLQILASKGYLSKVIEIYNEMRSFKELEGGKIKVFVTTAVSLTSEARENLKKALGKKLNAEVILVEKVDKSILGGFIIQIDDTLVNASVKLHLEKIGNCILERSKTYGV